MNNGIRTGKCVAQAVVRIATALRPVLDENGLEEACCYCDEIGDAWEMRVIVPSSLAAVMTDPLFDALAEDGFELTRTTRDRAILEEGEIVIHVSVESGPEALEPDRRRGLHMVATEPSLNRE